MSDLTTDSICQDYNIKCHFFICHKEKYDIFVAKIEVINFMN